jgi:hypothetical protein
MTPTQVRVVEAIVRDPLEARIEFVLREVVDHDVNRSEQSDTRNPEEFLACPGCRKVFSWLHFTRPHLDLKRPSLVHAVAPPNREIKSRVPSGESDSSWGSAVSALFSRPGSSIGSAGTNVTAASERMGPIERKTGKVDDGNNI